VFTFGVSTHGMRSTNKTHLQSSKVQELGFGENNNYLDLESNRKTPGRDISPMEMKGGTTEDDA